MWSCSSGPLCDSQWGNRDVPRKKHSLFPLGAVVGFHFSAALELSVLALVGDCSWAHLQWDSICVHSSGALLSTRSRTSSGALVGFSACKAVTHQLIFTQTYQWCPSFLRGFIAQVHLSPWRHSCSALVMYQLSPWMNSSSAIVVSVSMDAQ